MQNQECRYPGRILEKPRRWTSSEAQTIAVGIPETVYTNHDESSYGRGWHCYRKAPGTEAGTFRERDSCRNSNLALTTVYSRNSQKQRAINNVWSFRRQGCRRRYSASECEVELHIIGYHSAGHGATNLAGVRDSWIQQVSRQSGWRGRD